MGMLRVAAGSYPMKREIVTKLLTLYWTIACGSLITNGEAVRGGGVFALNLIRWAVQ